ncbi:MMPL family transporter [Ornithinicoccus halotolerans]|uniref:MMPL family transporter n=1 Tax=Ornithinicoccus halotolerans TaxID=1748220 RepID=UPI001297CBA9|nr:MMPL family transporter [Ornithinicoccus halotolerans]
MALILHRLGRWSATHRWTVVLGWVLVVATAVTGVVTLSRPLTDDFTVPGSRFQTVLDQLEAEIPEAAGLIGTVTFTTGEPFTADQQEAVGEVTEAWSALEGVIEAPDPFATQQQLDQASEQVTEGREQLADREAEIAQGWAQLEEREAQLQQQEQLLDQQQAQLEEQEAGLAAVPEPQRSALAEQLEQGRAQLEQGRQQLADARGQLQEGRAELERGEDRVAEARVELEQAERFAELTSPVRQVSPDETLAMTQLRFDSSSGQVDPEVADEIQRIGESLAEEGVTVDYSAEIVSDLSSVFGPGEAIGLAVAAVVLLVMLGTLLAAGLPLLVALVGVGVGIGAAMTLTVAVEMTTVTPALALMLGLAVGIDYSLFILNRHRSQLQHGMAPRDSIALATGTAGNAVTFAGLTVMIALAALAVTGMPFLTVMGLVAAGTVAVAVLASVTLTPALLSLLAGRALPRRQRRQRSEDAGRHRRGTGAGRWVTAVQGHPWLTALAVVVVAGAVAAPAPQLRLGLPDGSSEPAGSTAYRTYDQIRDAFGAGANGPLVAVATLDQPAEDDPALTERQLDLAEDLAAVEGVRSVVPFGSSEDRTTLAFQVVPEDGPSAESTVRLVETLDARSAALGEAHDARLGLTGQTVANIDISEQLADALPVYLAVVVGLSLLLLLLVFRSVWVPLLATAGFLLSVAAAFGGVVAVYQLGLGGGLFGVHEPGPVLSFLPILLIGVLFGLAMDYQVFLVSAMREAHVHGATARAAVARGFDLNARVVTAAAIIMASVFGGFVFAELTMIRPIGLGLALGVLVDAFLVRMTLTPAVLTLLGERAWWLPRWLARLLPHVDVEGARLERSDQPADAPQQQPAPVSR